MARFAVNWINSGTASICCIGALLVDKPPSWLPLSPGPEAVGKARRTADAVGARPARPFSCIPEASEARDTLSDDARGRPVGRRQALKRAAAIGGALWVAPAVQSVNMTRAWAQVGSGPPGQDPPTEEGPVSERRYTVRFDIGRRGAVCSQPSDSSCRCLAAEPLAGGCSFARASYGGHGTWTVAISGQGARVLEGSSVCGDRRGPCAAGSPVGTNAMAFVPHRHGQRGRPHRIGHIEVTFSLPTSASLAGNR
jgi:hypothetical protein